MKKQNLSLLLLLLISNFISAQSSEVIKKYIFTYKDIAVAEMQRTGVPAAITLAQGIHETGAGTSDLVIKSNNHFGIKCKTEWKGESVYHDDDAKGECFRKYDDPSRSYIDHSDFLKNRSYYASLFKLDPLDYEAWAHGLKKAGYATNPKYPQILIKLIKDYNLQNYSLAGLDEISKVSGNDIQKTEVVKVEGIVEDVPYDEIFVPHTYPSGVFQINETKVVFIPEGTSFLKIANENNLSLSRLFEFNDLKPVDISSANQLIYLQRKRKTGANEFHIVVQGETLHSIAQVEAIRIENLLEYNFLKTHMQPAPGEKLYLRNRAPSMPALATLTNKQTPVVLVAHESREALADNLVFHVVQPKETIYGIAKKYAVAIDDLMKWNDLQTIDLRTGQHLRISKRAFMPIKLHDKIFDTYLSEKEIQEKIKWIAGQLNHDYKGKMPLFIAILNGSFMFAADLFKSVNVDAEICFIKLVSYKGMKSSGSVITAIGLDVDLFGRDVIIVEDIVDTGKTLNEFLPRLHYQQPNSLKIAALLHKPDATQFPLTIDYLGFSIPDKFVVGYGLDYDGLGRNLKEIFQLKEDTC